MADWIKKPAIICNPKGLHARAAAKFVKLAGNFQAQIFVNLKGKSVSANSIMSLLMLGAGCGTEITLEAKGKEAQEAVTALATLIETKFGEE